MHLRGDQGRSHDAYKYTYMCMCSLQAYVIAMLVLEAINLCEVASNLLF